MQSEKGVDLQVQNLPALAGVICGAGVVIGSLGPWVKATLPFLGTITVNGTDGNNDGLITLVCGVLAGLVMAVVAFGARESQSQRWLIVVSGILFLLVAGVATYDWANLQNNISDLDEDFRHLIAAGWGLYLTGISGAAGLLVSIVTYSQLPAKSQPIDGTQVGHPAADAPQ